MGQPSLLDIEMVRTRATDRDNPLSSRWPRFTRLRSAGEARPILCLAFAHNKTQPLTRNMQRRKNQSRILTGARVPSDRYKTGTRSWPAHFHKSRSSLIRASTEKHRGSAVPFDSHNFFFIDPTVKIPIDAMTISNANHSQTLLKQSKIFHWKVTPNPHQSLSDDDFGPVLASKIGTIVLTSLDGLDVVPWCRSVTSSNRILPRTCHHTTFAFDFRYFVFTADEG